MTLVDKMGRTIKRHGRPFPGGKPARRVYRKMNPRKKKRN